MGAELQACSLKLDDYEHLAAELDVLIASPKK